MKLLYNIITLWNSINLYYYLINEFKSSQHSKYLLLTLIRDNNFCKNIIEYSSEEDENHTHTISEYQDTKSLMRSFITVFAATSMYITIFIQFFKNIAKYIFY